MIHTWLDGELSPDDSAAFQEHIATCKQCADRVAEARGLVAASSRIVSALDIVPGGVLPIARSRPRAWYSSAQFRAAAAVVVVAGASLLVFRKENQSGATVMKRAVAVANEASAPVPAVTPLSAPATPNSTAQDQVKSPGDAAGPSNAAANAPMVSSAKGRDVPPAVVVPDAAVRSDALTRQKDAGFPGKGVKGGTASGVADSSVDQSQRSGFAKAAEEPRTNSVLMGKVAGVASAPRTASPLNDVVVTGVAQAPPEPKLIRVDSTKTPKQSFYRTATGATLVLTEIKSPDFTGGLGAKEATGATADRKRMSPPGASTSTRVMTPPAAPIPDPMITVPPAIAEKASAKPTINTITWFDATGLRRYILSGPVPVADLEAAKGFLQKTQR
ncbi:MAG: zf-HC2 domain-containing protein [Gemmatimonadaceae bacterium]